MADQTNTVGQLTDAAAAVGSTAKGWINTVIAWGGVFVAKYSKGLMILAGLYLVSKMLHVNAKIGGKK